LEVLNSFVQEVLGKGSFALGFYYGVSEVGLDVIEGSLDLVRMIVLEGIYQRINSPLGRWYDLSHPMALLGDTALDYLLHDYLEAAHREFQQLMEELEWVGGHLREFFGAVWNKEVEDYSKKWQRYKELASNPSIANNFEAGRIAGQAAMAAVLLLATFADGLGLVLKGAQALRQLPELIKWAKRVIKGVKRDVPPPPSRPALPPLQTFGPFRHYTDSLGRPWIAEGPLQSTGASRSQAAQRAVSGPYNAEEGNIVHASHMIPRQFGGSPEAYNLVPVPKNFNIQLIKDFEDALARDLKALEAGDSLFLRVEAEYIDSQNIPKNLTYRVLRNFNGQPGNEILMEKIFNILH
jgi:hypothetical protein